MWKRPSFCKKNRDQNIETVIEVFGLDGVNLTQKNLLRLIWIIIIIVLDNIGHESLRVIVTRVVPLGAVLWETIVLCVSPLAVFDAAIRTICDEFELDFHAYYACIGLWNSFFLTLYALLHMSTRLHLSKRWVLLWLKKKILTFFSTALLDIFWYVFSWSMTEELTFKYIYQI